MSRSHRRRIGALLCLALAFFVGRAAIGAGASTAAPVPTSRQSTDCAVALNGFAVTTYRHSSSEVRFDLVEETPSSNRICAQMLGCTWRTDDLRKDDALSLVPAASNACKHQWVRGASPYTLIDCRSADVDDRLEWAAIASRAFTHAQRSLCGANSGYKLATPQIFSLPAERFVVFQLEVAARFCLALATNLLKQRTAILFIPSCANDTTDLGASAIVAALTNTAGQTLVVGASTGKVGVAVPLRQTIDGRVDAEGPSISWGWDPKVTPYVTAWLDAVVRASKSTVSFAESPDDPFPAADPTDVLGRMSRWMIAAMLQVANPPFSANLPVSVQKEVDASLKWMARQELTGTPLFANTLLRGEAVRRDWIVAP